MRQELNRINRPIYGHDFRRKPAHRARHAVVRALSLKNGAGLMTNSFIIGLIEFKSEAFQLCTRPPSTC